MPNVSKYNANWPDTMAPLEIELECIKYGGKWVSKGGKECGAGMLDHLMNARKLAWPHRYRHQWTDLMYQQFIENDVTVLMGCASSQKTSHATEYVLLNYWTRPNNTLVVLSTVNMEKLEIGIWGEAKMLWSEARQNHDWLAGNMIDHKKAISTDCLEDDGVRDMRKGIIGRPCLPSGSLVDTPRGQIPIESIQVGDEVYNASGIGTVKATSRTPADSLVRFTLEDGRFVDCTPDHPIFTQDGWKKSIDLSTCDLVFSADETLSLLQSTFGKWIPQQKILLKDVQGKGNAKEVQRMHSGVQTMETTPREILQHRMRRKVGSEECSEVNVGNKMQALRTGDARPSQSNLLLTVLPNDSNNYSMQQMWEGVYLKDVPRETLHFLQSVLLGEMEGAEDFEEQQFTDKRGISGVETVSERRDVELFNSDRKSESGWSPSLVQSRHCISVYKTGRGNRRWGSQNTDRGNKGQKKGFNIIGTRVVSVEILEQASDPRFDSSRGCYTVYNLEVAGHPSYSVNNVIVHNCYVGGKWVGLGILAGLKQDYIFYVADELQFMQEAFSLSWPHLFSNGNVKIIGSGNPKHDPDDELGKTAEPKQGWNAMPEPEKTEVWSTKFMGGKCINLVGTDSPNFHLPPGAREYPKLIGKKFADRIAHDHGSGSFEYYRLVKGVMKVAFVHSRVITRQLCREHKALEQVKWKDTKQTHIYALDPSYGGEDRCVGMPGKFGEGVDGKQILELMPYRVFKLDLRKEMAVEDQIAEILAEELDTYDVAPENCFYDSTGKGTIGAAFARKFGHRVPVAVDSGAQPTKRPVREDLYVEEKGAKRLKRCDEHYSKFVTEMWFSVRYTIEAEQLRGLLEDVMAEGCARIYEVVKGNRYEIEAKSDPKKKEDLKRRLGKSPDLFDAAVILCEGARQRGFKIRRLGSMKDSDNDAFQWLNDRVRKHDELMKSKQLNYATA